jgi:hypothetical protein
LYFAAFCSGLSKTGIAGVGIISVGLFPLLLSPRDSIGAVLLMLVGADIVAVLSYRREAEWSYLFKLLPWTVVGIIAGFFALDHIRDADVKRLIGGILLLLVLFMVPQRLQKQKQLRQAMLTSGSFNEPALAPNPSDTSAPPTASLWVSGMTGILAGFTTMTANAAGPIMILYLLAMRLPKVAFIGTAAWFFFVVNLFKVPFGIALGTVTPSTALLAIALFPGALAGGLLGKYLLPRTPQALFEWLAIVFTFAAGVKLLF